MSSFNPVQVLKGVVQVRLFSRVTLRKILLVTQFVFSIVFVVSIILIYRQLNYMVNANMGFDREQVFNIYLKGQDYKKAREIYSRLPQVARLSGASHVPGEGNLWDTELSKPGVEEPFVADCFYVDSNYILTMGLDIVAGRDFPTDMNTEQEKFILINETAVKNLDLVSPVEALGTSLMTEDSIMVEVIGVVKDYKYVALFMPVRTLVLRLNPKQFRLLAIRLHPGDGPATVARLKETWKEIDPLHEMEGDFLDAQIREYYSFFEDILYTVGITAFLALLIASLGLLGMATYSAQTRLKEIGVRKVFGAETRGIVFLIARSYLLLMGIAALIAAPLSYLVNKAWLQYIAHPVRFGPGTLLAGILVIVFIGLLAISYQTWKAGNTRPARILRYE